MSQGCFSFLERMPKMLDKILVDDVSCEEEFVTEVAENDDLELMLATLYCLSLQILQMTSS